MFFQSFVTVGTFTLLITSTALAGTSFRLEIGPPVAAGTGAKIKDFKKVVLVVRPLVCDKPGAVTITGTAEGVVNGARQSIPLNLVTLEAEQGIHAVPQQWPSEGQWLLQLNGSCPSPKASASTIVPLSKSGFVREKTQVLREPATKTQVEAALADLVRSQS